MADAYQKEFAKFLEHTNEKAVLLAQLSQYIKELKPKSLLDIGAGNGLLSIPLSRQVEEYTAVEEKAKYVEILFQAGLKVVAGEFPLPIAGGYDLVLSSHSLSYRSGRIENFVKAAWDLVNPGGAFLIITFRSGEDDDWTRLLRIIDEDRTTFYKDGFLFLQKMLSDLGLVTIKKITTEMRVGSLNDLIEALSFVYSNAHPELKEKFMAKRVALEDLLEKSYKNGPNYVFPFQHFFVSTRKEKFDLPTLL